MKKGISRVLTTLGVMSVSLTAFAEAAGSKEFSVGYGMVALGAAFAICIAAFGGALGQGKAVAAALEKISVSPGSILG